MTGVATGVSEVGVAVAETGTASSVDALWSDPEASPGAGEPLFLRLPSLPSSLLHLPCLPVVRSPADRER